MANISLPNIPILPRHFGPAAAAYLREIAYRGMSSSITHAYIRALTSIILVKSSCPCCPYWPCPGLDGLAALLAPALECHIVIPTRPLAPVHRSYQI